MGKSGRFCLRSSACVLVALVLVVVQSPAARAGPTFTILHGTLLPGPTFMTHQFGPYGCPGKTAAELGVGSSALSDPAIPGFDAKVVDLRSLGLAGRTVRIDWDHLRVARPDGLPPELWEFWNIPYGIASLYWTFFRHDPGNTDLPTYGSVRRELPPEVQQQTPDRPPPPVPDYQPPPTFSRRCVLMSQGWDHLPGAVSGVRVPPGAEWAVFYAVGAAQITFRLTVTG